MGNTKVAAPAGAQHNFSPALTAIDTSKYEQQLEEKAQRIRTKFAQFKPPQLEVFRSQPSHYRMRCARPPASCTSCRRAAIPLHSTAWWPPL